MEALRTDHRAGLNVLHDKLLRAREVPTARMDIGDRRGDYGISV